MDNKQRIEVMATVLDKTISMYEDISYTRGIPMQVNEYEVRFETEDGVILYACVSQFEYDVVEKGDRGLLVYSPHKQHHKDIQNRINIISFADIIIDFKME